MNAPILAAMQIPRHYFVNIEWRMEAGTRVGFLIIIIIIIIVFIAIPVAADAIIQV
jgi:hypothetical protein